MPGRVIRKDVSRVSGWALHPTRLDYPVTLNVFLRAELLVSTLVPVQTRVWTSTSETPQGMFVVDLAKKDLGPEDLSCLTLVIGESDERLEDPNSSEPTHISELYSLSLDDILAVPLKRSWVTGMTYYDAIEAAFPPGEVVELLYRDILGRPADESGHKTYTELLSRGGITFDEIRAVLLSSDEFKSRRINTTNAPGPIFSRRLLYLSRKAV